MGINFTRYDASKNNARKNITQAIINIAELVVMISAETAYSKHYIDKLEKLRKELVDIKFEIPKITDEFKARFRSES